MKGRFSTIKCTFVYTSTSQFPVCFGLKNLWNNSLAGSNPAPGIPTPKTLTRPPWGQSLQSALRVQLAHRVSEETRYAR